MAFVFRDLTATDGGGSVRTYAYKTSDAQAVVEAAGYFNEAYQVFLVPSVINVVSDHTGPGTGALRSYVITRVDDGALPRPAAQVELTPAS